MSLCNNIWVNIITQVVFQVDPKSKSDRHFEQNYIEMLNTHTPIYTHTQRNTSNK